MKKPRSFHQLPTAGLLRTVALIVAVLTLAVWQTTEPASAAPYAIEPPPGWVQSVPLPDAPTADSQSGLAFLLGDYQYRVGSKTVERYYRHVKRVMSTSGLKRISQLSFEFEPSYQRLVIHHLQIQRGAETINALRPGEIKIIQKEADLDQQLYNGLLSALIILNDVRVGDTVDYAYSVVGDNPVLGGRYADSFRLATYEPVQRLRFRLLWPSNRTLHYRTQNREVQPVMTPLAGEAQYLWEQENVKAVEFAAQSPKWFDPLPTLYLSEFGSWQEVVRWALPLYRVQRPLAPQLARQIEQWRAASDQVEERVRAALRFVQDDVRYMGIEMGPNSHQPTPPPLVLQRRFGDCKDKSLLLLTVLSELGVTAYPALINTEAKWQLDKWEPSPYAFDHVIVQATVGDKTYWFDPTISFQRGSLSERYNPDYQRALVVREGNADLETIPQEMSSEPTTIINETYRVNSDGSATRTLVSTYRRADADGMRHLLDDQTPQEYGKAKLDYYAESEMNIEAEGVPSVTDDQEANRLVLTEQYRLPSFWQDGVHHVYSDAIYNQLQTPDSSQRDAPQAIAHPVNIQQVIELRLPQRVPVANDSGTLEDDVLRFRYQVENSGNLVRLHCELQTRKDHVPAAALARHTALLERIGDSLSLTLYRDGARTSARRGTNWTTILVYSLVFGPFLVFGLLKFVQSRRAQGRQTEFKKKFAVAPGEVPETAIELPDGQELSSHLAALTCPCGTPYYEAGDRFEQASGIFDGRRLLVVGLKCATCRNQRDVYFMPPQPSA